MFEMLGNWSFGDYFKKEAIGWAWELLVGRLGIPEDRIYTTIFKGSSEDNVPRDDEAFKYWEKCFTNPSGRILEGAKKDNFWEMGETGPCGPCSEIHVDIRDDDERTKLPGKELVNKGHPHVIEIWNLVFIQYNRKSDGSLEILPSKHVDTGMGFERLCMIIQGRKSNYETDIFQSVIREISVITGKKYGQNEKTDIALRVVADHIRAVSFSIADGQLPSNNKAGYVIRRILRRAVRYGYNRLGIEEPFMYRLVPVLASEMGAHYPELVSGKDHIAKIIFEEETAFLRTLGKGLKMIERTISDFRKENKKVLPGKVAFEMFDTFGFPVDLTQLILKENDMELDLTGFEAEMKKQKERSREDASVQAADWVTVRDIEGTEFTGYEKTEDTIKITKYRKVKIKGKESCHLVFDKTPFYAESGGQAGDTGFISSGNEKTDILDTIRENNQVIHIANKIPSDPTSTFTAVVDLEKRLMTANNHTATHLIHYALRSVLGKHVEQKGSLVNSDRLRFDFSHFSKLSKEELSQVEKQVNQMVRENNRSRITTGVSMEKARAMGAMALFGEKYGDTVRVVEFGDSVELCGGTHVESTGSIGLVKIVSEIGIAAGIRRIEAITASRAEEYINEKLGTIDELTSLLKSNIVEKVEKLISENSALRKSIEKYQAAETLIIAKDLIQKSTLINRIRLVSGQVDAGSSDVLKNIAHHIKSSSDNTVLAIGSVISGKASLLIMVSEDLVKRKSVNAVSLINEVAAKINGGGGGHPHLATAGGKNPAGIPDALAKVAEIIQKI